MVAKWNIICALDNITWDIKYYIQCDKKHYMVSNDYVTICYAEADVYALPISTELLEY